VRHRRPPVGGGGLALGADRGEGAVPTSGSLAGSGVVAQVWSTGVSARSGRVSRAIAQPVVYRRCARRPELRVASNAKNVTAPVVHAIIDRFRRSTERSRPGHRPRSM